MRKNIIIYVEMEARSSQNRRNKMRRREDSINGGIMFLPFLRLACIFSVSFRLNSPGSPTTSLDQAHSKRLFLAPMNPLDEKLTSPRRHSYVHQVSCTTLSKPTRWISRSIGLPDNPRLLFRDPISLLLFLWSYVQLTVQVVCNITKSKLDGLAICIVASSELPTSSGCLKFLRYFYQTFYTIVLYYTHL